MKQIDVFISHHTKSCLKITEAICHSLEEKGILAKVERQSDTYQNKTKKCIAVNPYIFLKGQDIEKDIVNKFKDTKWANLQN